MWNNCIWQISKIYFFLTVDNRHTNFINVKLRIINLGEIYSFIPCSTCNSVILFRGLDEVANLGRYKFLRTLWLNGNRVSLLSIGC